MSESIPLHSTMYARNIFGLLALLCSLYFLYFCTDLKYHCHAFIHFSPSVSTLQIAFLPNNTAGERWEVTSHHCNVPVSSVSAQCGVVCSSFSLPPTAYSRLQLSRVNTKVRASCSRRACSPQVELAQKYFAVTNRTGFLVTGSTAAYHLSLITYCLLLITDTS